MWEQFWTRAKGVPIRWIVLALVIIVALLWLRFAPREASWSPARILGSVMPEPRTVTKIERVEVPGPERIRIIPKEKIVVKYRDLPTSQTIQDNAAQVVAVADIPPSPAGGVAMAVLHTGPDNVAFGTIEYRPAMQPFFAFKRELGVRAGYGTGGTVLGELYVRPLRVGPVEVEVRAYGIRNDRSGADFGAMVLGDYRF